MCGMKYRGSEATIGKSYKKNIYISLLSSVECVDHSFNLYILLDVKATFLMFLTETETLKAPQTNRGRKITQSSRSQLLTFSETQIF